MAHDPPLPGPGIVPRFMGRDADGYAMTTTTTSLIPATDEAGAGSKACSKCGLTKPHGDFYVRPASPDGFHGTCKTCQRNLTGDAAKSRTLRNRAHQRALTVLAERHVAEFGTIKAAQLVLAEAEAAALSDADGLPVKLKAGRRGAGQNTADRAVRD